MPNKEDLEGEGRRTSELTKRYLAESLRVFLLMKNPEDNCDSRCVEEEEIGGYLLLVSDSVLTVCGP